MKRSKKRATRLRSRIIDWENFTKAGKSDIVRKHPNGFKKPGSNR